MNQMWHPTYKLTSGIISLIAEISEYLGRLSVIEEPINNLRLRRINQIKTIHGSLAIEGNTLSISQITAILEGKRVLAPEREIQEVKNALRAYDIFPKWNPYSIKDLQEAHAILTENMIEKPGKFRTGGVGVAAGGKIIHLAPPADEVPALIKNILNWLKKTDEHPLISSSVFHYEFEYIHPFFDGNGRMGRLWQTLLLSKWNSIFSIVPVESLIHDNQQEYYESINKSTIKRDSSVFIQFILKMILQSLQSYCAPGVTPGVTPEVKKMLNVISCEMTRREIQEKLGLKDEKNFRENYIHPGLKSNLIEMTIPEKPNSRLQKYRLTSKGISIVKKK